MAHTKGAILIKLSDLGSPHGTEATKETACVWRTFLVKHVIWAEHKRRQQTITFRSEHINSRENPPWASSSDKCEQRRSNGNLCFHNPNRKITWNWHKRTQHYFVFRMCNFWGLVKFGCFHKTGDFSTVCTSLCDLLTPHLPQFCFHSPAPPQLFLPRGLMLETLHSEGWESQMQVGKVPRGRRAGSQ